MKLFKIKAPSIKSPFLRIVVGVIFMSIGAFISLTIIGAIIGIPLILTGWYICYKGQKIHQEGIIRNGVKKALEEEQRKYRD